MLQLFRNFIRDEQGQDTAEYALLLALLAIVVAAVYPALANELKDTFNEAKDCLSAGNCPGS